MHGGQIMRTLHFVCQTQEEFNDLLRYANPEALLINLVVTQEEFNGLLRYANPEALLINLVVTQEELNDLLRYANPEALLINLVVTQEELNDLPRHANPEVLLINLVVVYIFTIAPSYNWVSHCVPCSGNRRRKKFCADSDEESDNVFRATFGNRCYTWSFRDWDEPSFQTSSAEFEWRDQSRWNKNRRRVWDSASDIDDDDVDDKSCIVGSYSDRMVLGLPPTGPLKIDVVKSTFRSLALKWHPDKHQGPSQAQAEEKFKQCVNAYKALCNALPSK
ncbi:hypothetical protein IFM89_018413 [Coptis chinensis]|uniref:J domain-containing protein n=1 Tax=Coptis chinensis TaxID=261450 RepID=A0A835HQK4_9MAGN|nr:hypothetical protein IFM89_018413 [Coptis chinensis]